MPRLLTELLEVSISVLVTVLLHGDSEGTSPRSIESYAAGQRSQRILEIAAQRSPSQGSRTGRKAQPHHDPQGDIPTLVPLQVMDIQRHSFPSCCHGAVQNQIGGFAPIIGPMIGRILWMASARIQGEP